MPSPLWSQSIHQDFLFDHYGPGEGLLSAQVLALAKAPDGHLWLGTEKGLLSFDANDFNSWTYDADDPGSISGNYVSSLVVDRHGRIWIIASEFLNVFDPATGKFQNIVLPGFGKLPLFHGLHYDPKNDVVWITTRKGIYYTQGIHIAPEKQDLDGVFPGTFFNTLIPETNGILYLANTYGLYAFETAACKVTTYHRPGKHLALTQDDGFFCANMDPSGIIWLGTWTYGLVRFDPNTRDMENFTWTNPHLQQNAVVSLCHYPVPGYSDLIWLCTNQGLKTFDYASKTFVSLNTENYFDPSKIPGAGFSILPSKTDGLWIGTFKGLHQYDPNKQQFRKVYLPKPAQTVFGKIAGFNVFGSAGKDSTLWLSMLYGDILKYDLQKQKFLPLPPLLAPFCSASNSIHAMFFDHLNQLWISSDKRSVVAYNEDKSTLTTPKWHNVPLGEKILCFAQDNKKEIWMGGLQGLYQYDPHTNYIKPVAAFNQYLKSGKLMPGIGQMAFDQKNRIWFILVKEGSEIRMPICYDPSSQRTFIPSQNSLSRIKKMGRLEALAIGKKWSTHHNGRNRLHDRNARRFRPRNH
ncbi:MAG: hypothetical protein IPN29_17685 [Saprospiraceae bacterium]|nr:hypothetical protein [Saprospiraceae bacterium]